MSEWHSLLEKPDNLGEGESVASWFTRIASQVLNSCHLVVGMRRIALQKWNAIISPRASRSLHPSRSLTVRMLTLVLSPHQGNLSQW